MLAADAELSLIRCRVIRRLMLLMPLDFPLSQCHDTADVVAATP